MERDSIIRRSPLAEAKEKRKMSRETLGKYFYDLSKTSFTAMVVGSIVSLFIDGSTARSGWTLAVIGIVVTYIFAYIGYYIMNK